MTRSRLPQADTRRAVTVAQAAALLSVTPATIRNWLASGRLTGYSVDGGERRRHFVFLASIERLQQGERDEGSDNSAVEVAKERDFWRARAAQLSAEIAYLRGALEDALAAHGLQAQSADRLRELASKQHQALAQYTTLEDELVR